MWIVCTDIHQLKLDAKKRIPPVPARQRKPRPHITPFGQFKFLRAPYGISSISEHYNHRMDEAFAGLPGFRRVVDDVMIYDQDGAQHGSHIRQFLQWCKEKNITLNLSKWKFAQTTVDITGCILSPEGNQIDPSVTQAIAEFPTPANHPDLSILHWPIESAVSKHTHYSKIASTIMTTP